MGAAKSMEEKLAKFRTNDAELPNCLLQKRTKQLKSFAALPDVLKMSLRVVCAFTLCKQNDGGNGHSLFITGSPDHSTKTGLTL